MEHLDSINYFGEYPWLVVGFVLIVIVMLVLDLGFFHKETKEVSNKEALILSVLWIGLAMIFSGVIYFMFDYPDNGFETFAKFQSAYWIEKALSVDNLFVFILVFGGLGIPKIYQHKILFYGIIGAIVFRAIFIFLGVEVIKLTYIHTDLFGLLDKQLDVNLILLFFGFVLIYAGIKSGMPQKEEHEDITQNAGYRLVKKFCKISPTIEGDKFFVIKKGIRYVTPLFVALVVIEITDLMFAIDSIPAIFAIAPHDSFILYTSNIFAILGLRSLYFLLANSMGMFSKLNYGLAVILSFIGIKMIIMPFFHFPTSVSLIVIALVLIISVIWSIIANKQSQKLS